VRDGDSAAIQQEFSMRKMTKAFVLGALIATSAGAGVAAWAEMPGPGNGMHGHMGAGQMGPGMQGVRGDDHRGGHRDPAERLASLKTDLSIRPDQAASWDTYSKVVLDTAARMHAARGGVDRDAVHAMSAADREAFMTKMRDQRTQAHATVRAAAEALLPALDEAQKTKARTELPGLKPHEPHAMHHAGMGTTEGPAGPTIR
jgi:hypothetical protein